MARNVAVLQVRLRLKALKTYFIIKKISFVYLKTAGIIIGVRNLFEKDKVITIFTKEKGKISVLGKGMQDAKSKLSGLINYGNEIQLDLFAGKTFYYINGCDLVKKIELSTIWQQSVIFYWMEIVNKALPEEEKNESIYSWLWEIIGKYQKALDPDLLEEMLIKDLVTFLKEIGLQNEIDTLDKTDNVNVLKDLNSQLENFLEGKLNSFWFLVTNLL